MTTSSIVLEWSHCRYDDVDAFIDSVCAVCRESFVYFNWRPFLPDPKDDLVLECALAAGATHLVTYNLRDFPDLGVFGLSVVTPGEFIAILDS